MPVKQDDTEPKRSSVGKKLVRKTGFPLLFSERDGARSKKNRGGKGKNNTRATVWASFGPVSRVVTWLQANDCRFLSTTILTLRHYLFELLRYSVKVFWRAWGFAELLEWLGKKTWTHHDVLMHWKYPINSLLFNLSCGSLDNVIVYLHFRLLETINQSINAACGMINFNFFISILKICFP